MVPELLIGAAVDVVVRGENSFAGSALGVESRHFQLAWLAAINVVAWVIESLSEYYAEVVWQMVAQGIEHDLRVEAYDRVQHLDVNWHVSSRQGATLATLNDDVNQLAVFLSGGLAAILQTILNVILTGAVFAAAFWQLLVVAFLRVVERAHMMPSSLPAGPTRRSGRSRPEMTQQG